MRDRHAVPHAGTADHLPLNENANDFFPVRDNARCEQTVGIFTEHALFIRCRDIVNNEIILQEVLDPYHIGILFHGHRERPAAVPLHANRTITIAYPLLFL